MTSRRFVRSSPEIPSNSLPSSLTACFAPRIGWRVTHNLAVVPELGFNDIREMIVGSYRSIYRLQTDSVQLLTLHHGARTLDAARFEGA